VYGLASSIVIKPAPVKGLMVKMMIIIIFIIIIIILSSNGLSGLLWSPAIYLEDSHLTIFLQGRNATFGLV
jgi:hypothetical protein